jgi:hypothetical protein
MTTLIIPLALLAAAAVLAVNAALPGLALIAGGFAIYLVIDWLIWHDDPEGWL